MNCLYIIFLMCIQFVTSKSYVLKSIVYSHPHLIMVSTHFFSECFCLTDSDWCGLFQRRDVMLSRIGGFTCGFDVLFSNFYTTLNMNLCVG